MDKFWAAIKYIAVILLAITAALDLTMTSIYRFQNPSKTETEVFLVHWEFMPVVIILAILTVIGFNKSDE